MNSKLSQIGRQHFFFKQNKISEFLNKGYIHLKLTIVNTLISVEVITYFYINRSLPYNIVLLFFILLTTYSGFKN